MKAFGRDVDNISTSARTLQQPGGKGSTGNTAEQDRASQAPTRVPRGTFAHSVCFELASRCNLQVEKEQSQDGECSLWNVSKPSKGRS